MPEGGPVGGLCVHAYMPALTAPFFPPSTLAALREEPHLTLLNPRLHFTQRFEASRYVVSVSHSTYPNLFAVAQSAFGPLLSMDRWDYGRIYMEGT